VFFVLVITSSVVWLRSYYLFSGIIKELLPLHGIIIGRYLTSGFDCWALPHQWFDYRALPLQWFWSLDFTLTIIWFISSDVIPNEDFRVFVLRCRSTSHLICPVLFVCFTCYIQSYKSHKFHAYIHTFIHIHIHAYKYSCTYNMHTCTIYTWLHWPPCVWFQLYFTKVSSPVVSDPEMSPIKHFSSVSFYKQPIYKYISISPKYLSNFIWFVFIQLSYR